MEVRAVVNSRFSLTYTVGTAALFNAPIALAPTKDELAVKPLIAEPPALQTAISADETVYLPLIMK